MSKSPLLRLKDVCSAYRLIGECRDVGSDPDVWPQHALEGLCRLIGGVAATGGEGIWLRPNSPVRPMTSFDVGFDARGRDYFLAYMRDNGPSADPIFGRLQHIPGRIVTLTRCQLVPNRDWYRSVSFNDYRRRGGCDHQLTSIYQVSAKGAISTMGVHRSVGERDFSSRERRLMHLFHAELGPLVGAALVSGIESGPEPLSPRLRQTLACLLEGDSEKQVAARLGLSHATTHQYVTTLYRKFGVRSRSQLMAYAFKRLGNGRWTTFAKADFRRSDEGPEGT